jgi:ribosomal protein L27
MDEKREGSEGKKQKKTENIASGADETIYSVCEQGVPPYL